MLRKFSHPSLGATGKPYLEESNERQIPGLRPPLVLKQLKGGSGTRISSKYSRWFFGIRGKKSSKFEKRVQKAGAGGIRQPIFLFNYDIIQIPPNSPFESIQLHDFSIVTGCITTTIQV